jgi:hypothetical protein
MNKARQTAKAAIAACALLLSAGAVSVAPAQAELLITTRPGTECVEHTDTSPEIYYSGGNAANNAGGTNTFVCPASSHYLSLDGLGGFSFDQAYWWASVDDRNPSSNVSCYLRSCNQSGTSCINSPTRASTGTGIQTLTIVGSVFNWGTYTNYVYLRCSVPGKSNGNRSMVKSYTTYVFD